MEIFNSIKKYKDKIAVVDKEGTRFITYGELDGLSDKLCAKLIHGGIKEGSCIILNFDRCMEFIVSIFAVLKIKGIFISIIPEYPNERIEFIKKDANVSLILTEDYLKDLNKYSLDDKYDFSCDDNNIACIVYTSGSTGNPKGILYDRKGLNALSKRNISFCDLEEIKWGSLSPFSFVASLFEILNVLNIGGTLHILSNEIRNDVNKLSDYYEKYKLTCGLIPPRLLLQYKNKDKYLKRVMSAGEKLSNFYTDEFEVVNLYGQSEALPICMFKLDKKYVETPIGKAYSDAKIYLLDDNGKEVEEGKEGEICVIGDYSLCYLNLDEKTKETYEKLPSGEIRIHTGDIGKYDDNKNLIYVNRKDNMIKLHGQRIEPSEIEAVLNEINEIKSSIVKAFEKNDGTMILAAFYTGEKKVDINVIKENVSKKLPNYMMPKTYIYLDKFPINQNGKIDRKLLKLPKIKEFLKPYVKPTNEVENKLCIAFEKLFNIERVGIDDNFYELGGNSLNAIKLVNISNIENLTSQMILEGETIKDIAKLLINSNNNKPIIEKFNTSGNEFSMSLSQIYQYELCKVTNQPFQNMAAPFYYKLPKNTNINKLKNSIYKLVEDNKIYKTGYDLVKGKVFIHDEPFTVTEKSISESEFESYRLDIFKRNRDYKKDFLFEAEIIITDKKDKYLRFYIDHLLYDGMSLANLLKTISNNYNENYENKDELSIFDAIIYENKIIYTQFYKEALNYFDNIYKNLEYSKLLEKTRDKYTGGKQQEILIDIEKDKLNEYFIVNHISPLTYFMLALDFSIREYFKTKNFTYMNIYNGRYDEKLMNAHGCFAKGVFVKSVEINNIKSTKHLLKNLQNEYQKTLYYDVISFKDLLLRYKNIRSGIIFNYKEEFNTVFNIENENLNMAFFEDVFKLVKLYVDMDISLSKVQDKYYMMINTIRLTKEEVLEFEMIFDKYCHKLLNCDELDKIIDL